MHVSACEGTICLVYVDCDLTDVLKIVLNRKGNKQLYILEEFWATVGASVITFLCAIFT